MGVGISTDEGSTATEVKLKKPEAIFTNTTRKVAIKKDGKYSDKIEQIVNRAIAYLANVSINSSPKSLKSSYLELWNETNPCDYILLIDQQMVKPMLPKTIKIKFIGVNTNAKLRKIKDITIKVKKDDDIDEKAKELAEMILLFL